MLVNVDGGIGGESNNDLDNYKHHENNTIKNNNSLLQKHRQDT